MEFTTSRRLLKNMMRAWRILFHVLTGGSGILAASAAPQWHEGQGFRWAELDVPAEGRTGFMLLSPEQSGINFTNILDLRAGVANRVLHNGSGLAVGDFNNDGLPDVYFCSLNGGNRLFQNLGGLRFKDVTQESGIVCSNQYCRGAVFADINGDAWLDLLVATTGNGVACFLNDGSGKFTDATRASGTASRFGSVTLALADVDGNGTLDLYVANNRTDDIRDRGEVDLRMVNGKLTVPPSLTNRLVVMNGKVMEYGEPDFFYLNDGKGQFTPISWTEGKFLDEEAKKLSGPPLDWGLTATFRDLNGDGHPDLYVCNDYWTPDRIWMNDGQGRFRAADKLMFREGSFSSMGVDMADLTRSGKLDIFVADMLSRDLSLRKRQVFAHPPMASPLGAIDNRPQVMHNTLFQDRGDGTYAEIANYAGVAASDWSWSPHFLDVDLDGYEDLLIAAGYAKDTQDLDAEEQIRARRPARMQIAQMTDPKARHEAFIQAKLENSRLYPPLDLPIVAFRNLGNYQFEETTAVWGTGQAGVHHALAVGDLDGDGDLDMVVNNLGAVAGIYRNETVAARVAVRLKGKSPNTQGIGAKVRLFGATIPMQSQEVISGGRYMAGSDPELVFATGKITDRMTLEVRWRNGKRSEVKGVTANRRYEIDEVRAEEFVEPAKPQMHPRFEDVSQLLGHSHQENLFNDFERQPGLPRKLSQSGPGLAWADLNGDGWEDLLIGSGKGGRLAVFFNDGKGSFKRKTDAPGESPSPQDQTGIVCWREGDKPTRALVGFSNYEDGQKVPSQVREYEPGTGSSSGDLTNLPSSVGPLAMADMDGDGSLELFVGGRVIPGRYPEAASSHVYRRRGTSWQLDGENSSVLEKIGLVSGAVWSDLDADGYPELILACEWGPIRIFRNQHGRLVAWDAPVRSSVAEISALSQMTGWWNGITTGDLDGDGRLDIVAGNWGLNTPYQASPDHPLMLYYGNFAGGGTLNLIEAEFDAVRRMVVPRGKREKVAEALPELLGRFPTHKAYSQASMAELLAGYRGPTSEVRANWLASMVFLNRTNAFVAQALPAEAQFAPAFGVNVADFDGDGHEDVFLGQNFFANQPEVPRADAGRGLLLRGDGTGELLAVPGEHSGIKVYGEQRGAAVADYDQDGRVDLAVTQNAAVTKLFRNVSGMPGLRVRVEGPIGNPDGIGVQMRLLIREEAGPLREIHAGCGYWSQDSAVQVLAAPKSPERIWIRWPGGKTTTSALPADAQEVLVNQSGEVAKVLMPARTRRN